MHRWNNFGIIGRSFFNRGEVLGEKGGGGKWENGMEMQLRRGKTRENTFSFLLWFGGWWWG